MATEERQQNTALKTLIFEECHELSFFRAVQLIELLDSRKCVGESLSPGEEPVRFRVKPGLAFPPSDIASIREVVSTASADGEGGKTVEMTVTFMGLLGSSGPLPNWYTTLAMGRCAAKDTALMAFLDMFHHRLISLFYLGWKKNRFAARCRTDSRDRCTSYFLSLLGLGTPGLVERAGFPHGSFVSSGGQLSRPVCPVGTIEDTVASCLGIPAVVEQFIDRIINIEPEDRMRLGHANSRMGIDAVCGCQAWENQTRFRLNLGPLPYSQFLLFLPGGAVLSSLVALVRFMVGVEYEFEVRSYLRRDDVPGWVLGGTGPDSPRLGWSSWLKTPGMPVEHDPCVTFEASELRGCRYSA